MEAEGAREGEKDALPAAGDKPLHTTQKARPATDD